MGPQMLQKIIEALCGAKYDNYLEEAKGNFPMQSIRVRCRGTQAPAGQVRHQKE